MPSPKTIQPPADKFALYEKLVQTIPAIERKGDANPYTSHNGNMFSYLNATGALALRLPTEEREKFLAEFNTTLFEAYGVVMKEYVTVPDTLLQDTKKLKPYFQTSYTYVQSLKPKPTTRKKRSRAPQLLAFGVHAFRTTGVGSSGFAASTTT